MNKTVSYSVFKDNNNIRAALVKQEVKHTVYNLTSRPNFEQLTLGGGDFNTFLFKINNKKFINLYIWMEFNH